MVSYSSFLRHALIETIFSPNDNGSIRSITKYTYVAPKRRKADVSGFSRYATWYMHMEIQGFLWLLHDGRRLFLILFRYQRKKVIVWNSFTSSWVFCYFNRTSKHRCLVPAIFDIFLLYLFHNMTMSKTWNVLLLPIINVCFSKLMI